jgi:hypothetical protein
MRMAIWDTLRNKVASNRLGIIALGALALFALGTWFFGWNKPSRAEVESFLVYSLALETSLAAFGEDGAEQTIQTSSVASIGAVDCHGESKRHQAGITYYCFYTLNGPTGAPSRLVLQAIHNRGWKRLGMASVGDYRVSTFSAKLQREIFVRYDVDLPAAAVAEEMGNS